MDSIALAVLFALAFVCIAETVAIMVLVNALVRGGPVSAAALASAPGAHPTIDKSAVLAALCHQGVTYAAKQSDRAVKRGEAKWTGAAKQACAQSYVAGQAGAAGLVFDAAAIARGLEAVCP